MTRYIDADALVEELHKHFGTGFDGDEWWNSTHVLTAIAWTPTVDAVPVEFIERQIKSAEWTLTHIGNSDYYGNTCEELSLKCYILRSLINKWRDE